MVKENFKSVYIHNGCRNPKVKPFKKVTFCQKVEIIVSGKIRYLIDLNMSLRDAEIQKSALNGKWYFETMDHACAKLSIALNDVRIEINVYILKTFVTLAKKLRIYD